ncbi:MAG: metallopeptidase family protein [Spirochaetes bacterium]|nr:metallopeptidase family protein [Spirochaetota bacterium]
MSKRQFYELVSRVYESIIESLPTSLKHEARNVLIIVQDNPENVDEDIVGLYDGTPLSERGIDNQPIVPDRIYIYRIPLLNMCENRTQLCKEVRDTIIHELGHFFGFDDNELKKMGLE